MLSRTAATSCAVIGSLIFDGCVHAIHERDEMQYDDVYQTLDTGLESLVDSVSADLRNGDKEAIEVIQVEFRTRLEESWDDWSPETRQTFPERVKAFITRQTPDQEVLNVFMSVVHKFVKGRQ